MKTDDLINALGGIDDEFLPQPAGKRPEKKKRPFIYKLLAAAACLVLLAGAYFAVQHFNASPTTPPDGTQDDEPTGEQNETNTDSAPQGSFRAFAIAAPEYPVQEKFPRPEDYTNPDGSEDMDAFYDAYTEFMIKKPPAPLKKSPQNDGINGFYGKMLPLFLSASDNSVCSPVNIMLALSMLAESTGGDSRRQILSALGAQDMETQRKYASEVFDYLYTDNGMTTIKLANSVWLDRKLQYNAPALQSLADNYYAASFRGDMQSEEYSAMLRDWLNGNTGKLLEGQISGLCFDPNTVLGLASAVEMSAMWTDNFYEWANETLPFHGTNGDAEAVFMTESSDSYSLPVFRCGDCLVCRKSLSDDHFMYFVLPDEGKSLESVIKNGNFLTRLTGRESSDFIGIVKFKVPKFDIASQVDLREGLKSMGITDVLSAEKADFSPIIPSEPGDVVLSSALHGARVLIDENGVKGAAYTLLTADATGGMPEQDAMDFILDRPFLFLITSSFGIPIFAGTVTQP